MSKKKRKAKKKKRILLRILKKIFLSLYKIVDKFIVTPVSKFMLGFIGLFKTKDRPFDRLLNNKIFLIVISLIMAATFFVITDTNANILINNSADVMYGKKVTALYNEEAYVIEGLPNTVDITLIGRRADLYLAKQYPSDDVVVDLRDLKPGTHKVNLKYSGNVASVDYRLTPSTSTVVIYEKISESRRIKSELLYESKLDSKYTITNIGLSREDVFIKGAEYKLDKVATVKALIDVKSIVNPTVGKTTLKDIPLVAYDQDGNKLNIEIVPATIDATIEIASPSKEVPFKVIPEGNCVFGKAIDTIVLNNTKTRIYGDAEALAQISYIPIKIDVSDLKDNTEFNINVSKPTGIKQIDVPSVVVKVTLDVEKEKIIDDVNIEIRNLENKYTAKAASPKDSKVSVIVKGTSRNLKNITKDNVSAYVDLQGLKPGENQVAVVATGEDAKLSYAPKTNVVTIIIK